MHAVIREYHVEERGAFVTAPRWNEMYSKNQKNECAPHSMVSGNGMEEEHYCARRREKNANNT